MLVPGHEQRQLSLATKTNQEGEAMIEIRDTGVGMPEHALKRALEPFFTTKGAGQGRGLGLSICHGIVTSMGGGIELESEVGRGTAVRVRLPASGGQAARIGPPISAVTSRGYVLVVDDEAMNRDMLSRRLDSNHDWTNENARRQNNPAHSQNRETRILHSCNMEK